MPSRPALVAIMGATGSGKSSLAERLGQELNAQLVNADAFQVYRGLDIGTNKPSGQSRLLYKNIDLVSPGEEFGVGEWIRLTAEHLWEAWEAQKHVIVVGGTGFYVRALFEEFDNLLPPPAPEIRRQIQEDFNQFGLAYLVEKLTKLNPELAQTVDVKNPVRVTRALEMTLDSQPPIHFKVPPYSKYKFSTAIPDEVLKERIELRCDQMFEIGWKGEVEALLAQGVTKGAPGLRAIGYHLVVDLCEGTASFEDVRKEVVKQTWQYARRQKTWLRSEPGLEFLNPLASEPDALNATVRDILNSLH